MKKYIIAAVADNGAIGRENALLWHISGDMKYFRQVTTGSPVIMGRKTFESIGRPLPKRRNIVISRSAGSIEGVEIARSLEEAFALAAGCDGGLTLSGNGTQTLSVGRNESRILDGSPEKCFVIGGGEIYRQAMAVADGLYVTEVHCKVPDADTFFPEISSEVWMEVSRSERMKDEESGLEYEFLVYERI